MSTVNEPVEDVDSAAKERLTADIESLKQSFGQLRSDLTHLINNAMGVGKSGAAAARDRAANAVGGLKDGIKDRLVDLKDKGVNTAEAAEQKLSDHPLATVLIAFGAGFIIAKILTRR
jgi:ElaB/YqjD/DUF883 family membrane-anchored ribosome-binding protein